MAEKVRLKREIGLFGASALGICAIVGSGIFIVTGIVAGLAGPAMLISILIAGVIAVFSALSVAEPSAYLPEEGGTYSFARKLISPFTGYIAGLIAHLGQTAWVIGLAGLGLGIIVYVFRNRKMYHELLKGIKI